VAKNDRDKDLFRMMRAAGVRKKVAAEVSEAVGPSAEPGGKTPKVVRQAVRDFSALAARLEDPVSGGPRKSNATAQKRAGTRKRTTETRRRTGTRTNSAS
jgi:hypothetical protein